MTDKAVSPGEESQQRRARLLWLANLAHDASRPRSMAATAVVLSGCLLIAQAAAIAWLIQKVIVEHVPVGATVPAFVGLAVVLVLRLLLDALAQRAAGRVADTAKKTLRSRVYARLLDNGPLWLRQRRTGELGELLLAHGDALEGYFTGYQLARVEMGIVPLVIAAAVAWVDWRVAIILLVTAPLIPIFMMLVGWGAEAASRRQLGEMARMSGHFADRLKGLGLLRIYGRGEAELAGIAEAAEGVRDRSMRVLRIAFLSSTTLEFFASVSVAMIALYFGLTYLRLMSIGPLPSLGVGMFCLLLAPEFYGPLRRLAAHYHDRANALAAVAEVERQLGGLPDDQRVVPEPATSTPLISRPNTPLIRVKQVALRPRGAQHDAVRDLSFDLKPGQRLAMVGASGSGKSTLLEALAGWLPPREGVVETLPELRLGYAGQRPYLFHGTIADNLRLADPQASERRLMTAAETAQVLRFAQRLPNGLDTVIGERGFGLSGGEARRIALARLLLREPDVLLLDEPTAFLDPDTERELLRALGAYSRGRSVILATHSDAAMHWADDVIRLGSQAHAGRDEEVDA